MSMESQTMDWLVRWFQGRRPWTPPSELAGVNYFQAGLIDSLGVIELIADLEAQFGIRFEHEDYQRRDFATFGGLAALVVAKQNGGGSHV
jgi:acyl carrier protein